MQTINVQLDSADSSVPTPSLSGGPNVFAQDFELFAQPNVPVTLDLTSTGSGDPYLQLLDSSGSVIAVDDDSGSNLNSQLTFTPVSGVTYTVRAMSFEFFPSVNYSLSVTQAGDNAALLPPSPTVGSGPVRRIYDILTGSHVYTTNATEISQLTAATDRYRDEGNVFDSIGPNQVTRFLNNVTNAFFYTISAAEANDVRQNPGFSEIPGGGFNAAIAPAEGLVPVFRFYNTVTGRHFFTPNSSEALNVRNNLPGYRDEGIGFYADPLG
ncbi:MAG: hypothetical protein ACFCA4_19060 [Cyanophyceae cyanobacterium]